ncbi:MAG: radical SAM protein [Methanomicrobiales archaeon]|nr:radical SAM protein [Methanomicrobiales archaeon]
MHPFYMPPSLLLRQAASALVLGLLTEWRYLPRWLMRHGVRCMRGAAGALGMGCIGFPNHPVWEITARCNLDCIHCHARGSSRAGTELSTEEGMKLLGELAVVREFRMCAFTGGEPLLRDDLFELLAYARGLGFSSTIATNGTLVDREIALRLKSCGVEIAAVSLDGGDAKTHDAIRGVRGAFDGAIEGISVLHRAGIPIHINITAMEQNLEEMESILELVNELDAAILLMYQLVPIGRAERSSDQPSMRRDMRGLSGSLERRRHRAGRSSNRWQLPSTGPTCSTVAGSVVA